MKCLVNIPLDEVVNDVLVLLLALEEEEEEKAVVEEAVEEVVATKDVEIAED